jgi:hypothetical protein
MTLPNASIEVEKRGLGGVTTTNDSVHAVIGCASDGPYLTARKVQRRSLGTTFISGPAVSATQIATDGIDSDVIFVRVPSTPRVAIKTLDLTSFTGDSTVIVTGTATIAGDIRIDFTTDATVGIAGGVYRVSVDGGSTYGSGVALGVATSITLYGVTFAFQSGQSVDGVVGCLLIPASESIYNIDLSGVTGTSVVDISGTPNEAHDGIVNVVLGGNPSVDGIRLAVSLDGGRRFAPVKRLGTSLTFAIDDRENVPSGITLTFDPFVEADLVAYIAEIRTQTIAHFANIGNLDELIALVNDLRIRYEAHRILTAGSVHGLADSTNIVNAPVATDLASAITLVNELVTDYEAHRILTAGSVHGAADSINVVTTDVATNLATAVRRAKDLRTQYEAHRILTAGSVHGLADSTNVVAVAAIAAVHTVADVSSGVGIPGAPTDFATAIGVVGALLTAALLHVDATAGVHGASDATGLADLAAIDNPTTMLELFDAANAFVEVFFGDGSTTDSGHALRTASAIHDTEDTTNLIVVNAPDYATLETGDRIVFKTTAPEPQASDVVAAMQVLKASTYVADFDFIHVVAEADQTFAGTVSEKLNSLELASTYTLGIMSARDRACGMTYDDVTGAAYPGEKLEDWSFRLDQAFDPFSGERAAVGAGMRRATNPISLWTKRVPVAWTAVNRLLTRPVQEELGRKKAGQVAAKTSITNAANDYVEYNARNDTTLVDRFVVLRDFEDADGLYFAKGSTMAPSGSDFSLITYIRVMNFATRLFKQVGQEQLGNGLALETTGPRAGKAREVELRRLDREIKTAIESKVSPTKGTASGLSIYASRDDNLLPVVGGPPPTLNADVVIVPIGYVGAFRGRIRMASTLPAV